MFSFCDRVARGIVSHLYAKILFNSKMNLEIVPYNSSVSTLYDGHQQAHTGDAGLDLFVPEDTTIPGHSSGFVPLGISCAAFEEDKNVAWLLFPRSSICKTPLRLANSSEVRR